MVKKENVANRVPGTGKAPSVLLVLVPVKSIRRRQKIIWQQSGSIPDYPEKKKTPPLLLLTAGRCERGKSRPVSSGETSEHNSPPPFLR